MPTPDSSQYQNIMAVNTTLKQYSTTKSNYTVTWKRPLKTNDTSDFVIPKDNNTNIIWAFGDLNT